ncbi:DMT family transporter [Uliginosibacterium aquaticum]|uniref:DMT family transporter n=1 Tax=Uliginosibacterium aquaticum TaxID=2731212 RepID=A0ABX2IGD5_9RHOO|nr:DMT family transporter [Uliginosibacterium aquaticum]NSL55846.1 DMT family transporter [Uliginosibacterium aquaticum]
MTVSQPALGANHVASSSEQMKQAVPGGLYLRLVLTTFFWGGTFIAGRFLAQSMPHFLAATLRFCFALLGLLLYALGTGQRLYWPDRRQWGVALALGASGIFAYNAGFFAGLAQVAASRAALLVAASPVITLCTVQWLNRAAWSARQISGVLLSFCGAVLVVSHGDLAGLLHGAVGQGELFIFGAVVAWVVYTLVMRYYARGFEALSMTFFAILCGTLLLAVPAGGELVATGWPALGWQAWLALAYMGLLGTSLAFVWYSQAVAVIGAARATQFTNLVPVFGVLLSVLLLGESLVWSSLGGGLLVVAGVMWVNRAARS